MDQCLSLVEHGSGVNWGKRGPGLLSDAMSGLNVGSVTPGTNANQIIEIE